MQDPRRALVEHATDAMSVHQPSGAFRYVSPGFTDLVGYPEDELIGASPIDLLHPEDAGHVASIHRQLVGDGDTFRVSFRIRRVDHTYLWVEATGRSVTDADGGGGIVAVTRDIEVRRSLLEALEYEQRLSEQLERLAEQQHHFVTAVAHRARTPMTAVLGFAQTLHRSGHRLEPERRAHLIERLAANAQALAQVIEDATSLDQVAAARSPLRTCPCDLEEIVDHAVAQLADPAAPLETDLAPDARTVPADPVKLDRALRALLRNAITHTPAHTPIAVRTRRTTMGLQLTVEDRGQGIRDELKRTIFEPFAKGDAYLPHDPGLGLGLHLVSRIAAEHGGRAWVSDVPGGGAAFHLLVADPQP